MKKTSYSETKAIDTQMRKNLMFEGHVNLVKKGSSLCMEYVEKDGVASVNIVADDEGLRIERKVKSFQICISK